MLQLALATIRVRRAHRSAFFGAHGAPYKKKSDYHQSSARDPFDGMRSLTAFEMTSRRCHFDEHSEEKSPGVSSGYDPETIG
jgi:hypothetical protein